MRFEILKVLELLLDVEDKMADIVDVNIELLDGFNWEEQKMLARIFVDFSKNSAIQKATYSKTFIWDLDPSCFCLWANTFAFRAINPSHKANTPKSTPGIDSLPNLKIIAF